MDDELPTLPAILLAAGSGTRLGRPKALLDVRGRSAVAHVSEVLRMGGAGPVIAVTGAAAAHVEPEAQRGGARAVHCAGWEGGRTASLQAGLAAVPDGAPAVLVALVDMPLVTTGTVGALISAWTCAPDGTEVIVPSHEGRRGHPIVLARSLFPALAALGPDTPLRDALRTARRLVVDVDDPGVLVDLDTPEDLARHGLDPSNR